MAELNSKLELDRLNSIVSKPFNPNKPSEIIKFYGSLERFITDIHKSGYELGYKRGSKVNELLK
tara:strand:+ start:56945 stop:57136 length:192 start_codon:yes stop_codon:yes gene_type:complete